MKDELVLSGDCCCEAALCGGEYVNCSKPIQLGTKKKLVFRVLKRQNSRSFGGFAPGPHQGPALDPLGAYQGPLNPQLNFAPPQYQLLSDGPESINISCYLFRKNDMKLTQNIHGDNLVFLIIL